MCFKCYYSNQCVCICANNMMLSLYYYCILLHLYYCIPVVKLADAYTYRSALQIQNCFSYSIFFVCLFMRKSMCFYIKLIIFHSYSFKNSVGFLIICFDRIKIFYYTDLNNLWTWDIFAFSDIFSISSIS